jgi:release factor glutamine methyltransferase
MNETELLFTHILNCNRLSLYLDQEVHLSQDKATFISSVLKRRISGEPLQYILGETEFFGLEFKVNPDVFIPRPETEILVETVIDIVKVSKCQSVKVLDLGTGSGCIAVSLARFLPNIRITATDISDKAIKLAKSNARLNNVADKITFIHSDLFSDLGFRISDFDVIVSNPPYIPTAEIVHLQSEIRHEPIIALDGGSDGLDFYRRIISNSPYYLKEEGFLIMEMGFNQAEDIKNIFKDLGNFEIIEMVKDYNNIDRVIVAKVRQDG